MVGQRSGLGRVLFASIAIGLAACGGPSAEKILERTPVPPAPVLSPDEALESFRLAPGFRIELVAAEPDVVDPVAMDWDDEGRLYVVEMRGFMPNLEAEGEDAPVGRVVVLEDEDGDGVMDRSDVHLDGLVLPRAIAVLPEGVLIGVPPDLILCRDTDGDRACDSPQRLTHYGLGRDDPEHLENGLLPGIDGYLYNAKSSRRFWLDRDTFRVEPTAFRGQWGIAQDDEGRLFHNHNSAFLYGDAVPADYAMRQPGTATAPDIPGASLPLSAGAEVHGVRVAVGLNRAYLDGTLRPDGRQLAPTAVSGLVIQRGDQFGPEWVGDAFVPEPGSGVVAHFEVVRDGLTLEARHVTVPDAEWGEREFLASSDERFRPVDLKVGPDGALWVIDMYRGVIQHANYVSEHYRRHAEANDLVEPGAYGRIWRIVREDRPRETAPSLGTLGEQLEGLDHANGWVRDRASRRIAFERDPAAAAALADLGRFGPLGRVHALATLARMGALDLQTWQAGLDDADPRVRRAALRAGERLEPTPESVASGVARLDDADEAVRLQALHSLGSLPAAVRPLAPLLAAGRAEDARVRNAALSGLAGVEEAALAAELAAMEDRPDAAALRWIEELTGGAYLAAAADERSVPAVTALLDRIHAVADPEVKDSMMSGVADAQRRPTSGRFELAAPHPLVLPGAADSALEPLQRRLRRNLTWPGDETPGGARPLTAAEQGRREAGRKLFEQSCAACHGSDGRGQAGVAPPLAGSPWARDADAWLVRIVLQGVRGPILVEGDEWNGMMPGHGHDPRFDDETLAGLLTHVRRSWGHADEPVSPEAVARVRAETRGRGPVPWTVEELLALEIEHRLDRYVGVYKVPLVSIELEVVRRGPLLAVGMKGGGKAELAELDEGLFTGESMVWSFDLGEDGLVEGASVTRDGTTFPVSKEE